MLFVSLNSRVVNLEGLLEASWCSLQVYWGVFEASLAVLERLGPSWGHLGGFSGVEFVWFFEVKMISS